MSVDEHKANLNDGGFLFRFRSAKALLDDNPEQGGFQELEKQTIYFAQPEALNDPMEGLDDAFWDGDQVLWENLFRHYALVLIWYAITWLLGDPENTEQMEVFGGLTEMDLPSQDFRAVYREFCSVFCAGIESKKLAKALGDQTVPLRRARLTNLLQLVHRTALFHLFRVLKKHDFSTFELANSASDANSAIAVINGWAALAVESEVTVGMSVEYQLEYLGSIVNRIHDQLELGMLSRVGDRNRAQKLIELFARFPETYIDSFLRDLLFTPWRVACFSRRCVNTSMWGTYGAEHRGAAIVFRTQQRDGARFFRVKGMVGSENEGCELKVRSVTYRNRPPPVDSFLEIAMLPSPKLQKTWMMSESDVPSIRFQEVFDDIDAWRKAHWEKASERQTWKHPDWAHEDEQRLIVSSLFADDPAPEPLTYHFSQLEGIVFGMRMCTEDKLRIANVIERKCRAEGRADFRFYQAYYSASKGEMDIAELGLLKFNQAD